MPIFLGTIMSDNNLPKGILIFNGEIVIWFVEMKLGVGFGAMAVQSWLTKFISKK